MTAQAHTPSRSSFPVVVAIIGLFLLFWFLTSKVYVDSTETPEVSKFTVPDTTLAEHNGAAESLLSTTKVTDPTSGKVRLSIERAKELVIAENAK
ncbi:hypothetical protein IEN85_02880 [Pelagicoccus sp. NFK12]|uniref:Uncharacterized protein n=1 Tax=Pelagicoccus enzymogenes TaxID=2773457 RepID=A0A927IDW8_9BACT|nr:hypothetical protein [Pelagicoccus enzymogenes]MBD5778422.1 hypothetical protein [Pelagicoccus enzymogenes]MDQ8197217.1 hypothetical protein [Pelagicoccus enzymogenes]